MYSLIWEELQFWRGIGEGWISVTERYGLGLRGLRYAMCVGMQIRSDRVPRNILSCSSSVAVLVLLSLLHSWYVLRVTCPTLFIYLLQSVITITTLSALRYMGVTMFFTGIFLVACNSMLQDSLLARVVIQDHYVWLQTSIPSLFPMVPLIGPKSGSYPTP